MTQRLLVGIRQDLLADDDDRKWSHARRFVEDNIPGVNIHRMTFERVLDNGDTVVAVEYEITEEPLNDD